MTSTPFVGGPLDGRHLLISPEVNEIHAVHEGLVLRYNRVGAEFWQDEWSRPPTEAEQAQIDAFPPFMQVTW